MMVAQREATTSFAVVLLVVASGVHAQATVSVNGSGTPAASNAIRLDAVAPAPAATPVVLEVTVRLPAVATATAPLAKAAADIAPLALTNASSAALGVVHREVPVGESMAAVQAPPASQSGVALAPNTVPAAPPQPNAAPMEQALAAPSQPQAVPNMPQERVGISKMVKGIALLSNILLQLSPMRAVRDIRQVGSTLAYDPLPIFLLWLGCLNWFFYASVGFLAGDTTKVDLLQAYIIGVVFGAFYVQSFWKNCHDPEKFQSLVGAIRAGAMLLAFEFLCAVFLSYHTSIRILGAICASFSILVTAAPLVSIEDIFRTQSVASMQTDMVIVCFCGCCAWTALGFMMHDVCIALPNCFGIAIGSIQVHLILKFSDVNLWGIKNDERTRFCPEKTESCDNTAYEASLYKQAKIFVLVCMAHAHFVATSYLHFATDTLSVFCAWLTEARPTACQPQKLLPSKGYSMWPFGNLGGNSWRRQKEFQHEDMVLL